MFLGIFLGCIPPTGGDDQPSRHTNVKAPAQIGLTIEVPARDLFAADAHWRKLGKRGAPLHIAVRHRGAAVPCAVEGGADGVLHPGDVVTFKVSVANRHSPYLVYQVVHARSGKGELCRLIPAPEHAAASTRHPGVVMPRTTDADSLANVDAATWDRWRHADYLILAPGAWLPALSELIAHRERVGHTVAALPVEEVFDTFSDGNPDPVALHQAISVFYKRSRGRLKYVLLVGDVESEYAAGTQGPVPVPAFYRTKIHYPGYSSETEYPTDHPYGVVASRRRAADREPPQTIAVGRLPARSSGDVESVAAKIVAYERGGAAPAETAPDYAGAWQRRLVIYGGPANYGKLVDALIENIASHILSDVVPYDYDMQVVFAKADSPYAFRFDKLGPQLVSDLNKGSLFAAYFGHGLTDAFDNVFYRDEAYTYGHVDDMRQVAIRAGKPVFLSFSCNTGAFDQPKGKPSLAEVLGMGPHGPIAVWASSRSSHPYPNALYARAFVEVFLDGRPPTLGDGLLEIKRQMRDQRMLLAETLVTTSIADLKREHEGLYNLIGDPALRLRYADALQVAVEPSVLAGRGITVKVASRSPMDGHVLVTLETERRTIRGGLVPVERMEKMSISKAFATMTANHETAIDKVVTRHVVALENGRATVELRAPKTPGSYVVKAVTASDRATAAGHAKVSVIDSEIARR